MFCYLFWIFDYATGGNSSERFFFFSLSQPFRTYFGLQRSYDGVFSLLVFFAIFFEFWITSLAGTHRNDFFNFLSFSALSVLFWLENKLWWSFLIFRIFFAIFFEFFITRRVGTHRNDFFFFFSLVLSLSLAILAWKAAMMEFSTLYNFFAIFF